jgi:hypothetical protein
MIVSHTLSALKKKKCEKGYQDVPRDLNGTLDYLKHERQKEREIKLRTDSTNVGQMTKDLRNHNLTRDK